MRHKLLILSLALGLLTAPFICAQNKDTAKKTTTVKKTGTAAAAVPAVDTGAVIAAIAAAVHERQSQ